MPDPGRRPPPALHTVRVKFTPVLAANPTLPARQPVLDLKPALSAQVRPKRERERWCVPLQQCSWRGALMHLQGLMPQERVHFSPSCRWNGNLVRSMQHMQGLLPQLAFKGIHEAAAAAALPQTSRLNATHSGCRPSCPGPACKCRAMQGQRVQQTQRWSATRTCWPPRVTPCWARATWLGP